MVPAALSQLQRLVSVCVCVCSDVVVDFLGLCHAVSIREQLVKLLKRFKIPLTSCGSKTNV